MKKTEATDIDARLAAARQRLADRQAGDEARRKERELEELERKLRDAEILDEMRAKHGSKNIAAVGYPEGLVVLKRGLAVDWQRFEKSDREEAAQLEFVGQLLAYPTRDETEEAIERFPQLLQHLLIEGAALYGSRRREIEGN